MCAFGVDTGMNRSEVGTGRKETRSFVIIMKDAGSPVGDRLFRKPYRQEKQTYNHVAKEAVLSYIPTSFWWPDFSTNCNTCPYLNSF